MLFSLDVIRARKGDCLMLHYGTTDDPHHMIIDGGPSSVYNPHLKPRLKKIKENRGFEAKEPLPIDLLMVSHVDDDHINGILEMTKELITAGMDSKKRLVDVMSCWHNSFKNIIGHEAKELTASLTNQFGPASVNGKLPDDMTVDADDDDLDEESITWSLKALASIKQGAQLRSDIAKLNQTTGGFELNPEYDGKLVLADEDTKPMDMGNDLSFTVVGPMKGELKKLQKKHQDWLIDLKAEGKSPSDVLSAYVDKSAANLSSIVVLAQVGEKTMLLTGDARGDKIFEGLAMVGLLADGESMHVDLLKVPHHGSANNLEEDFFARITAEHYVFSGNGEHGNPEREALEMLLNARGEEAKYKIHLTYPVDKIDPERKKDWEKERAKEKKKKEKNPAKKVRPAWSDQKHSLAALFADNPKFAKKVVIVPDDGVHLIDLLDKADF